MNVYENTYIENGLVLYMQLFFEMCTRYLASLKVYDETFFFFFYIKKKETTTHNDFLNVILSSANKYSLTNN